MRTAIVLVPLMVACGSSGGELGTDGAPDTPLTDAPPSADGPDDAPLDAARQVRDVTGTNIGQYVNLSGVTEAPVNLTAVTVAAYAPDGLGGMTVFPGTGAADGTFVVPDVPAGPYTLRVGNARRALEASTVNLSFVALGRPDVVRATQPTPMQLDLTGLAPWADGDELQLFSAGAGFTSFQVASPTADATTVAATLDWRRTRLVDATRGDTLTVLQVHAAGLGVYTAQAALTTDTLTVQDGVPGTIAGALQPIPQDQVATIDWRRTSFDALRAEVGAGAQFVEDYLVIDTLPMVATYGQYAAAPDLAIIRNYDEPIRDIWPALTYGNPFPASWGQFVIAQTTVDVPIPGGPAGGGVEVVIRTELDLTTAQASGIAPVVGPVRNVRVDGRLITDGMTGVGLNPVVSWDPPALGTPTRYRVRSGDATPQSLGSELYGVVTERPSVQLAPGTLVPGTHAFLIITAEVIGAPYPHGVTDMVTPAFYP